MAGGQEGNPRTINTHTLPVLTGAEDYQYWSESIRTHLKTQGVWRTVTGDHACPQPPLPGTTTTTRRTRSQTKAAAEKSAPGSFDEEDLEEEVVTGSAERAIERALKQKREWEDNDDKAHGIICSSLSDRIRHEVINSETSKILWDTLGKRYNIVSDVQSFEGLQTAIQTRYDTSKGVSEYITKMSAALDLFQKSLKKEERLPESVRIQFLLNNLGERWDTFLTSYLNSRFNKSTTTYDEITAILIQEDMRVKFNNSMANRASNIKSRGNNRTKEQNKDERDEGQRLKNNFDSCPHCKKKNHLPENCWKKHPEKIPQKVKDARKAQSNKDKAANAAKLSSEGDSQNLSQASFRMHSEEESRMLMAHGSNMQLQNSYNTQRLPEEDGRITVDVSRALHVCLHEWIIDSGSTDHLTRDEDSYIEGTRKPFRRCIKTATGQPTFSKWVGDILLKLWYGEGKYREIRLQDVLYIPEIKVNLLGTIRMGKRGIAVNLLPHGVTIYNYKNGEILGHGLIHDNTYFLRQSHDEKAIPAVKDDMQTVFSMVQKSEDNTDQGNTSTAIIKVKEEPPRQRPTPPATPPTVYFLRNQNDEAETECSHVVEARQMDSSTSAALKKDRVNLFTWHRRFAHLGIQNVIRASKMVEGMDIKGLAIPKHACESCRVSHASTHDGKQQLTPAKKRGDRIFVDLGGGHNEMPIALVGGGHYWMFIIDQYDSYLKAFVLRDKHLAANRLRDYIEGSERAGHPILRVHTDNGGEFQKKELQAWIRSKHIEWEWTAAYAHSQNAPAERISLTIMNRVRAVLHYQSRLPRELWGEILLGVVFLRNLSPIRGKPKTPYEMRSGNKPDVSSLRALGCKAYLTIPPEVRSQRGVTKIDPRATVVYLVGYISLGKQYKVWDPESNTIKPVRDLTFNEGSDPELYGDPDDDYGKFQTPPSNESDQADEVGEESDNEISGPATSKPIPPSLPAPNVTRIDESIVLTPKNDTTDRLDPATIQYVDYLVEEFEDYEQASVARLIQEGLVYMGEQGGAYDSAVEPSTYEEAVNSKEKTQWEKAMQDEIDTLVKRGTWKLVDLPAGRKAITGKWVYKIKIGADNKITRFKARWVARGFTQQHGVDYFDTYAPTAKPASIRILFAISAARGHEIIQVDFKLAFLQGQFNDDEVIYVQQPKGFNDGTKRVCQLLLPIYGLKQSARNWYLTFRSKALKAGLRACKSDECVFTTEAGLVMVLHVDDTLLAGPQKELDRVITFFKTEFEVSDIEPLNYYLGIKVQQNIEQRTIKLSQKGFADRLLATFNRSSKVAPVPMDEGVKLEKYAEEVQDEARKEYQAALGSFMYLMLQTRADLSFCIGKLLRYASNPGPAHFTQLKKALQYLAGTTSYGIVYEAHPNAQDDMERIGVVKGYTDADYAGCVDTRRSTTGWVYRFVNGPISWSSKRQTVVSLSTTEAEYRAIVEAGKEALWITYLLEELGFGGVSPMQIYSDNEPALKLSENTQFHSRTKHIDVSQHWIREAIQKGLLHLSYIQTDRQIADGLTKALSKAKFVQFVRAVGIRDVND